MRFRALIGIFLVAFLGSALLSSSAPSPAPFPKAKNTKAVTSKVKPKVKPKATVKPQVKKPAVKKTNSKSAPSPKPFIPNTAEAKVVQCLKAKATKTAACKDAAKQATIIQSKLDSDQKIQADLSSVGLALRLGISKKNITLGVGTLDGKTLIKGFVKTPTATLAIPSNMTVYAKASTYAVCASEKSISGTVWQTFGGEAFSGVACSPIK